MHTTLRGRAVYLVFVSKSRTNWLKHKGEMMVKHFGNCYVPVVFWLKLMVLDAGDNGLALVGRL